MKVLTEGHRYELESFEGTNPQVIQFIEKEIRDGAAFITVNDGTTNEEVIKVLQDRLRSMQSKFPCKENAEAQFHLAEALNWLEYRTNLRKAQNVEGKPLAHKSN